VTTVKRLRVAPVGVPTYRHCPDRLADAVALVTGSTHGIGLGIARRFAREGASVVVNDQGAHDGEAVADELTDLGAEATYVEADALEPDDIETLVERTVSEYGRIDALVNNVATWRHQGFADTELADWEFVMNGTVRSHWLTTKHAIEHMPEGGSVINISSVHALGADVERFPYNVGKAAVNALTRTFAVELGPLGLRANAIMPGPIDTSQPPPSREELEVEESVWPAGRRGKPADIAGLAAYLASEESSFVSGTCIPVDGGRFAVWGEENYREWFQRNG
jgi:glucose 1-dehydrogenase